MRSSAARIEYWVTLSGLSTSSWATGTETANPGRARGE